MHSMQSRVCKTAEHLSVHLSNHLPTTCWCGRFAAVGPAARRYRLIVAPVALSSKCKQFHVASWHRKLNTELLMLCRAQSDRCCRLVRIWLSCRQECNGSYKLKFSAALAVKAYRWFFICRVTAKNYHCSFLLVLLRICLFVSRQFFLNLTWYAPMYC